MFLGNISIYVSQNVSTGANTYWQTCAEHSSSPGRPSIGDSPVAKQTFSLEFKSSVDNNTVP